MYKNLSGSHTTAQHQMTEIACMLQFPVIGRSFFPEELAYADQNIGHILMHQLTVICIQNIIRTAFLVQSQRKRSVFILISKGKFHLITVAKFNRTSMNAFPIEIRLSILIYLTAPYQSFLQKFSNLRFFHYQLVLIRHRLIHTAATCREIAAHRISCLKRRFLQNFKNSSLRSAGTFFLDHEAYLLSRDSILDQHFLIVNTYIPLVRKVYLFYYTLVNFTFFHYIYSLSISLLAERIALSETEQ